jgi:hypothetical protein
MSLAHATDRYTVLPDDETLAATVVALEEHGFSVEVVPDLDAAREAVLARIPEGSVVMTNTSVTLQETGIAPTIDNGGSYESARNKMMALDFATQLQEMKAIAGQPDYALGSVHAVKTRGRSSLRRLRAEQPRRKDPRDPPRGPGPHPRRPHPTSRRVLSGGARDTVSSPAVSMGGATRIRVGIIGANPDRGWAAQAHIPALRSLADDFEITALSTTRHESAAAAAELFGVPAAFDNHQELVNSPPSTSSRSP